MTLAETIYQRSLNLPDEAAREALDFIEFLAQRYGANSAAHGSEPGYDEWFKLEVQRAFDDPRPGVPHEDVSQQFAACREALRAQAAR